MNEPIDEKIRPILDQALLRPMDAFEPDSDLILPQGYDDDAHGSGDMIRERNQLCLAVVIAVGPGWKYPGERGRPGGRRPLDVDVGDKVLYMRADAKKVEDTDQLLVLVRNHQIHIVVEQPARQVFGGIVSM